MKRLDPSTLFESDHLSQDLVRKTVQGGLSTVTANGSQFILRIAGLSILARLLTPEDYGVFGMVMVVVVFAEMFKDAGLSMATVQKKEISQAQISTLFWINILITFLLGLCVFASSPFVAWFYGKPELAPITAILSISFIISGIIIQHQALLRRHMHFTELALVQIATQIISLCISISLAYNGLRYWALVGGSLANAISLCALTFFLCPWIPGKMRKKTGVRDMLKFGGHLTGFNFINYFARNFDNILIGKFIGAEALGIYSRAYQLLLLPITMISGPLSNVALPALCRITEDRKRLHSYYLHILYLICLVSAPIAGIAYLTCNEIIIILLGPIWTPVSDVFKYLAIGGLLQPLYNTQAWLHLAVGRSERVFKWSLIGTPIIVSSFLIGLSWGVNGVAFCYSMAIIVNTIGSLSYAGKSAGLCFLKILSCVYRPITSCFTAAILVTILSNLFEKQSNFISIITKSIAFFVFYGACLLLLYNGIKPVRDIFEIVKLLTNRNGKI